MTEVPSVFVVPREACGGDKIAPPPLAYGEWARAGVYCAMSGAHYGAGMLRHPPPDSALKQQRANPFWACFTSALPLMPIRSARSQRIVSMNAPPSNFRCSRYNNAPGPHVAQACGQE